MTFKTLILIFFCIITTSVFSQKKTYFDEDFAECHENYAAYYRIVEKSKDRYIATMYYLNDRILIKGPYIDKACKIAEGKFDVFDSTGALVKSSIYSKNKLEGEYFEYYPNGQIKTKNFYKEGNSNGLYEEFYPDGSQKARANFINDKIYGSAFRYHADKTIALKLQISKGNGDLYVYYPDGKQRLKGSFKNGYMLGEWSFWNEDGSLRKTKEFNEEVEYNKILQKAASEHSFAALKSFDRSENYLFFDYYGFNEDPNVGTVDFADTDAEFPGGYDAMYKYINDNVVYPETAIYRNKQGTVYVQFLVEADGSISHVEVASGPHLLREESVKVVKNMPTWKPGEDLGVKVPMYFQLPIKYELE